MSYYVWVGPRDTDCKYDELFSETICYYSDNNRSYIRYANIYGTLFNNYIKEKMINILKAHPDARFIFYNPKIAYRLPIELLSYVDCLNDRAILDLLCDKIYTRYWLGRYVSVLPSVLIDSSNLSFEDLYLGLGDYESYVVQRNRSSAGLGTYILTKENGMISKLKNEFSELFIVSPYIYNGYAINVNAIIYEDKIITFPISLQISELNDERIMYHGSDYVAAHNISVEDRENIYDKTYTILERVKLLGYRGIIGVDFLITKNNIYFLEINPRYQASSFLLDIVLAEKGYPSLTELNLISFSNEKSEKYDYRQLDVTYSFYKYLYNPNANHLYYIYNKFYNNSNVFAISNDGWDFNVTNEKDAYCYSVIFNSNIVSVDLDLRCNVYPNINGQEQYIKNHIETDIGLKIALINQGCIIDKDAHDYLQKKGIIKKAVFSAIDFRLSNGIPINAPVNLKFTDFSPFIIKFDETLSLYYYDKKISDITIEMEPSWNNRITKNGIPFNRIAYISTDRLRLKHEPVCVFKKNGCGCHFCNVPDKVVNFTKDDFQEILNILFKAPTFRHILIGGGSGDHKKEVANIINVALMIREHNENIPIYLMSLPPENIDELIALRNAGITEVAFNIEIWNRQLAKSIMPGKGNISLEHYIEILKASTELWGKTGNVRTALIVGLNATNDLIAAIEMLCRNGIQPMLSVFRPMPLTQLENVVPLENKTLLSIYEKCQSICSKYNLELGPSCKECRNNMLAL